MPDREWVRTVLEEAFQSQMIDYGRLFGWRAYHTRDSRRNVTEKGYPDVHFIRPPEDFYVEFKKTGGRLSDEQKEWLAMLQGCGHEARAAWPKDVDAIEERLRRPRLKN